MKKTTRIMGVLALALGLGVGCQDRDDNKVDDRVERKAGEAERAADRTTDKVDQKWDNLKADVKSGADRATDKVDQKWDDTKAAVRDDDDDDDNDTHAADNTGVNERDRADGAKTAGSADMTGNDVDVMAKIRSRVVDDDSLSTTAHNVKIISEDGRVTLKGPVKSAAEKATIERIASDVAGAGHVVSQLEIAP
jgi:hyperosmotically inducible periplasmic protein